MSRFLLVVLPLRGHVTPMVGIADELVARGHRVVWAGSGWMRPYIGAGQPIVDCAADRYASDSLRPPGLRGAAALKFLVEDYLVPLAEAMLPGTLEAIDRFRPDVVVADQHTFAGAMAAQRRAVPWATSASTSAEFTASTPPKVEAWTRGRLDDLWRRHGLPARSDPRFSDDLVLAFTTEAAVGPLTKPHPAIRFVGPVVAGREGGGWRPPWPGSEVPTVLVTLGTANTGAGERFLRECATAAAARGGDLRAVIVDPAGHLGPQPDWITTPRHVPQVAVMATVDAVVCHAGHNTVCEALWHGLPLVVAPIRDDQPAVADQVVRTGTGTRLRFSRATAPEISDALDAVLTDRAFARAARRVQRSFHAAGGARAAADHLERLAS
ncbi:glycosyltransferase [Umezawaea sp. Da 62-37]|uniref:glycosyltransferase n=1 Tax=Umezawaea sp. Da 62-37 TaxID=3075927 RepID=UPI0028F725DF|nr:glycosyltransferase [Umezawaea sp. Da 62-37]WNV86236.1 glycosyltransferase [Umezawaea sp. Da 62-37]